MQEFIFVVHCERISKRLAYYLRFPANDQLIQRIKELPEETRKWNHDMMAWEVTTPSLFTLIKRYKGSNKIHFDFGNENSRKVFIQQIRKIEIAEEEKRKFIADLNIKKEHWVKYKQELEEKYVEYSDKCHALLKEGVKLYPHQIVAAMFMNVTRNTLISHEMGLGKAESLDSKLLTPNGWIRMGDVQINDFVVGSDGKPKKVLGVYPQGFKDIYEVRFSDGTSVECCDEHLWNVNTYIRNWRKNPFMTKTLREIMNERLQYKNGNNKWYIPIIQPVEFKENDLKINPYILGCLLGDGTIGLNSIQFTTADTEIIDILSKRLNENIIISKLLAKYQYSLKKINNKIPNAYVNELKLLNLLGTNSYTKFIPDSYKFSSIEQRLELLQGILDTDGHSRKDGIVELTLASKQLIEDVQFIVESLGGVGRLHEKWIKYNGENRLYYRLNIKLPPHFIPFKLKRKIKTFVAPTKYLPNRAIVDVKYVGKKEAQCILIDSEDHLYATDHCILTHNTLSAILYSEMNTFEKVLVITPNSLKFNFYNEVEKFTKSNSHIVNWKKNKCSIEDAKYIIVNYDYFNPSNAKVFDAKWKKLKLDKIDALICDECLTYDTKILTDNGELKIGDIVENALNVKVISYNHKLKIFESKSILRYLYNGRKKTIKVKFSNGVIIECTPDHKFYSIDDGTYKSIELFEIGEKLYEYKEKNENCNDSNNMSAMQSRVQTKKKHTKILFKNLLNKIYFNRKCEKSDIEQNTKWKYITIGNKNLSNLSKGISIKRPLQSKILFNKLFSKMENESNGNKKQSLYERICKKDINSTNTKLSNETRVKESIIESNDIGQSNVQSNEYRKNEIKSGKIHISFKRWKWKNDKSTIKTFFNNFWNYRNVYGIFNSNFKTIKRNECHSGVTTNTLQGGYRNTKNEISDRNRWKYTQNEKMEIFGQEENGNIGIVWVESIEILESRNRPEFGECCDENKRVYDLEIKDNHNFIANGILVSNCQKLKNSKSNTYKNFKRTFKNEIFKNNKVSKIFLSGTPAPNRAYELYTILHEISPVDFATKKYFYEYYCGMTYDTNSGWGYITNTMEQRFEELYYKIAPYTHRKRKFEVLKDLPDKIYQKIILELEDREYAIYDEIEAGVANEFLTHPTSNPLTIMIRLRQYTASLKIKHVVELIENILETGEKVVVVDTFKDTLYELKEKLGDVAALHTGDQSVEERAEIVKQFQDPNSSIKVFLGSIQTCNYGLTLTAASKLFILTLPYSVGEYDQVSDRLHRIGQKSVVNIYPLIFRDTIDDYVFSAIESKRKEIVKVIDNEDYKSNISESVLSDVIAKIKSKHGM